MSCRRIETLVDGFLDGELPPEHTLEVEEHLSGCDSCQERTAFESALRGSLRSAVRAEALPSDGFEARLTGALRAERERLLETPSLPPRPFRRATFVSIGLALAATLGAAVWFDRKVQPRGLPVAENTSVAPAAPGRVDRDFESPEQVLEELVDYHAAPPTPQITEQGLVEKFEPEVGVPIRLPSLKQYGAAWEGGSVIPMKNQRAAFFRYRLSNHPVTIYVYDAGRVPLRGVLEPRVVHNQAVHVGRRRGYSIAAVEQSGVGYAVASDLKDDASAELATTIY